MTLSRPFAENRPTVPLSTPPSSYSARCCDDFGFQVWRLKLLCSSDLPRRRSLVQIALHALVYLLSPFFLSGLFKLNLQTLAVSFIFLFFFYAVCVFVEKLGFFFFFKAKRSNT